MSEAVRAFIAKLPPGDGRVGCNYLLYAFNRGVERDMELPEFEREVAKVTKTSTIYGRRFIDGVDVKGVRAVYLESFNPQPGGGGVAGVVLTHSRPLKAPPPGFLFA